MFLLVNKTTIKVYNIVIFNHGISKIMVLITLTAAKLVVNQSYAAGKESNTELVMLALDLQMNSSLKYSK